MAAAVYARLVYSPEAGRYELGYSMGHKDAEGISQMRPLDEWWKSPTYSMGYADGYGDASGDPTAALARVTLLRRRAFAE